MDVMDMIMEARAEAEKEGEDGKSELRQLADIERRYKENVKRYDMAYCQLEWLDQDEDEEQLCHCEFAAQEKVELDRFHNLCFRGHTKPYVFSEDDRVLATVLLKWSCHTRVLVYEKQCKELDILRGNKRTSTLFGLKGIILCGRCIFDAWVKFVADRKRGFFIRDFHQHLDSEEEDDDDDDQLMMMAVGGGGGGGGGIFNFAALRKTSRVQKQRKSMRRLSSNEPRARAASRALVAADDDASSAASPPKLGDRIKAQILAQGKAAAVCSKFTVWKRGLLGPDRKAINVAGLRRSTRSKSPPGVEEYDEAGHRSTRAAPRRRRRRKKKKKAPPRAPTPKMRDDGGGGGKPPPPPAGSDEDMMASGVLEVRGKFGRVVSPLFVTRGPRMPSSDYTTYDGPGSTWPPPRSPGAPPDDQSDAAPPPTPERPRAGAPRPKTRDTALPGPGLTPPGTPPGERLFQEYEGARCRTPFAVFAPSPRAPSTAPPSRRRPESLLGGAQRGRAPRDDGLDDDDDALARADCPPAARSPRAPRTAPGGRRPQAASLFHGSSTLPAKRPTSTPQMKFSRKWTKPEKTFVVTQREFARDNVRFLAQIGRLEADHRDRGGAGEPEQSEAFWESAAANVAAALDPDAAVGDSDDYFW